MDRLVPWLQSAYDNYRSSPLEKKQKMFKRLVRNLRKTGHTTCSAHSIEVKIKTLLVQLRGSRAPSQDVIKHVAALRNIFQQQLAGGERKQWDAPSPSGGPSAMAMLLDWLKVSYSAYAKTSWGKSKLLDRLQRKMARAGHSSCLTAMIRSQVLSLERQHRGDDKPTKNFHKFEKELRRIFFKRSGLETHDVAAQPRVLSSRQSDEIQDNSDTEDEMCDENATENALAVATIELDGEPSSFHMKMEDPGSSSHMPIVIEDDQSKDDIELMFTLLSRRHQLAQQGVAEEMVDRFLPLPSP